MEGQQSKAKGVVDIVFLIDATGSMQPCINALKENVARFIDFLTQGGPNNQLPVRDWRGRVVGYRDLPADGESAWFVDNPFVRDPAQLKQQLSTLEATGGGDEPESLLDALYRLANLGETAKGTEEDPKRWRYRSSAARVVIVFTDASFHETLSIPEAKGGKVSDVKQNCSTHRLILSIFAPDMPCYDVLSGLDKSEYLPIPYDKSDSTGAQKALAAFTADQKNFEATLRQLAASVSRSAQAEAL
jgi:hypothetical protein